MKKVFRIGSIESLQATASSYVPNELLIASRTGDKAWIQNLELSGASVKYFDGVLTISFNLRDGEFISLGDQQGIADKKFV